MWVCTWICSVVSSTFEHTVRVDVHLNFYMTGSALVNFFKNRFPPLYVTHEKKKCYIKKIYLQKTNKHWSIYVPSIDSIRIARCKIHFSAAFGHNSTTRCRSANAHSASKGCGQINTTACHQNRMLCRPCSCFNQSTATVKSTSCIAQQDAFVPAPAFIYTHGPFLSPGHSARLLYPRLPSAALPLTSLQALQLQEGLIQVGLFIRTYYFLLFSQQFAQKKLIKL